MAQHNALTTLSFIVGFFATKGTHLLVYKHAVLVVRASLPQSFLPSSPTMARSRSRKAVIRGDILKHQHNELKIPHPRETIHTAPGKLPADFTFAWGAAGDSGDKNQPKKPAASKTVTPDTKQTSESSAAEEETHIPEQTKVASEKAVDTGKGDDRKRKREKKGEEDEGIPEEPEGSEQPHQTRSSRQKARR